MAVTEHIGVCLFWFCLVVGFFIFNLCASAETLADVLCPGSNQRLLSAWSQRWFVPAPSEFGPMGS